MRSQLESAGKSSLKIRLMDFKPDKNPFKEFPANAQPKTPPNTIYTDGISTKLSTITLKS